VFKNEEEESCVIKKYVKKPVVVEAIQFTVENKDIAFNFVQCNRSADHDDSGNPVLKIQTLEGVMIATIGDYIIKGINGEFYPCKPDIFDATYYESYEQRIN
jgi:hypothetical protein